jgi:uncharacterized protein (DUF433 family)
VKAKRWCPDPGPNLTELLLFRDQLSGRRMPCQQGERPGRLQVPRLRKREICRATSQKKRKGPKSSNSEAKNPFALGREAKFKTFKEFGTYIVADPKICHGRITFRGTRIFVNDVLEMVSQGMAWEKIIYEWHGFITTEAISEAVTIASRALFDHVNQYAKDGKKRASA